MGLQSFINSIMSQEVKQVNTDSEGRFYTIPRELYLKYKPTDLAEYHQAIPVRSLTAILGLAMPTPKHLQEWYQRTGEYGVSKALKTASKKGTNVHNGVEYLLEGDTELVIEDMTHDEVRCLIGFTNFVKDYNFKRKETSLLEDMVFNITPIGSYAGTLDAEGWIELPKGKRGESKKGDRLHVLLDWKTSPAIYMSHKVQIYGYYEACKFMRMFRGSNKIDALAVVQLGADNKSGYKVSVIYPSEFDQLKRLLYNFLETASIMHPVPEDYYGVTLERPSVLSLAKEDLFI